MNLNKVIATLVLLIHGTTQAEIKKFSEDNLKIRGLIQETFLAKPADADIWFFEFKNKTKEPLFLTIICEESANYTVMDELKVAASTGSSEKSHGYLRLAKTLFNVLTGTKRADEGKCYLLLSNEKNTFAKAWKLSVSDWENSRIYLTYEKGKLRLQTGSGDKTQSGIRLYNWIVTPTIISIDPDFVVKKLVTIAKMQAKK